MTDTALLEAAVPFITAWYRENGRSLPWREDPTPYHVWISEIMLQQTRIEAVIPYYARFLAELPTVHDLADCDDDRLMKLWEGLGYYSRARNLKKAARAVVENYRGELPETASELKKLPGIGDYTAGAVASIAHGQPEPAVDGNVMRVVSRLLCDGGDIADPAVKKRMTASLREIYPMGNESRCLTEGLMELGEVVCIPNGAPRCELCPLNGLCRGHLTGSAENYPVKSPKKPRKIEERTVFLLKCGNRYAIRRREEGLLIGMWEFPSVTGHLTPDECADAIREMGMEPLAVEKSVTAKHIFTHVEWHMIGYTADISDESPDFVWKTADEIRGSYALPTALKKYAALME